MEGLVPPSSGSPEEIQAWNNMMDTMVTFIKASTHLMNTITKKVRYTATPISSPVGNIRDIMGGCEPECEVCRPKPPCGICSVDEPNVKPSTQQGQSEKKPTSTPTSNVKIPIASSTPTETPSAEETAPDEVTEKPAEGENAETEGEDEQVEKVPESSHPALEENIDASQSDEDTKKKCVCAAIRAKRMEEEKKDACICKPEENQPAEPPVEKLCGCGPTTGNQAAMMQEMLQKLANAQEEINQLQEEMARLQRMDTSKRIGPHGGPNPAALYREIMRDSDMTNPYERSPIRISPQVRQRLFQKDTVGSADESRLLQNLPQQKTLQNTSTVDSPPSGLYGGTSVPERIICPKLKATNIRRGLFQSDSAEKSTPGNIFSSTAYDISAIPGEETPESFLGCIPCDEDKTPNLGFPSSFSPVQMRRTPLPQRSGFQDSIRQRSRPAGMIQQSEMAERSAVRNRSAPSQYIGGVQAPCRRSPGGGSAIFRSMPSNLQEMQNSPDAGSWRPNEFPNYSRSPESLLRRIIVCGPPQSSSENCPSTCNTTRS